MIVFANLVNPQRLDEHLARNSLSDRNVWHCLLGFRQVVSMDYKSNSKEFAE